MKESTLLPLLRSQTQGDLLALLYMNPEEEFTLTEAARKIGVSAPGVHHEATRLVETGFLLDRREGNNRLIRAATDSIIAKPLTDLLALTYGPIPVLAKYLSQVDGVQRAYIFGSWAARYLGERGAIPKDVDVLAIGEADMDELEAAVQEAEKLLHREVNIQKVSLDSWLKASDQLNPDKKGTYAFLATIRSKPLVEIDLREGVKRGVDVD